MRNLLNSMKTGYAGFIEDGQYLMLFMVALLLLWILEDPKKKEFRQFGLVMLLVLLFPITAKLLLVYQTAFYTYEDLWELLPVTALISYGLVTCFYKMIKALSMENVRWKAVTSGIKEKIREIVVSIVLIIILFLCGTLTLGKSMSPQVYSAERIPKQVTEVLDSIALSEEGQFVVLAPDEIMTWARAYNGNILLPYGRDLIEPQLSAFTYDYYGEDTWQLHEWLHGTLPALSDLQEAVWQDEMYLSLCASSEYHYMIFSRTRHDEVLMKALSLQMEYELFDETDKYVIYKLQ